MRYISAVRALGQVVTPIGQDAQCIRDIQIELYQRGTLIPKTSITGNWNADTSAQLDRIYGSRDAWVGDPICDISANLKTISLDPPKKIFNPAPATQINAQIPAPPAPPVTYPAYQPVAVYPPNTFYGIPYGMLALGAGALALLLMRKQPTLQAAR